MQQQEMSLPSVQYLWNKRRKMTGLMGRYFLNKLEKIKDGRAEPLKKEARLETL